jgi:exosortase
MITKQKQFSGAQFLETMLPSGLLLATWLLVVRQLSLEWTINPEYQYGWIVPFLSLLLWHQAWGSRPAPGDPIAARRIPLVVVLLVLFALPLRIIEEANPDWRALNYYYACQAILITALMVDYSGGWLWLRHFAFPLLFPIVAVPWPGGIETEIIQTLQRYIASFGVEAASWMGWSAFQKGNLIVLSQGVIGINEACSGIRSLQSSLMIALFLGQYFKLTVLRRLVLIALALFFAFALNVIRAFFLISMMELHGATEVTSFHDPAGFTIAAICLLLLWIASTCLAAPETITPKNSALGAGTLRFPMKCSMLLLAAWIGTEGLNQAWYVWHERNNTVGPVWSLKWPPPRPQFQEVRIADEIQIYLHYNDGKHGRWTDQYHWDVFYFSWKPGRSSAGIARFHHPDICLPSTGFVLKEDLGAKIIEINGLDLPLNSYIFQDPLSGQLFYVFQIVTDDRVGNQVVKWQKGAVDAHARLQAAWEGYRNPGQRSLMLVNIGAPDLAAAEAGVQSFLADSLLVPHNPIATH